MSIIEGKIKSNENNSENQIDIKNKETETLRKDSISSTKELIKKLLEKSLNNSLLKLELNSKNHISSIDASNKIYKDFRKEINNLNKSLEEAKKKKDKGKKNQIIKKSKKPAEESHHIRSGKNESNKLNFKSKLALGNLDNNKKTNNNFKNTKKVNLNMKNLGNRTYTNFRLNEDEKTNKNLKKTPYFGYNTTRNLKNINITKGLNTPRGNIKAKMKNKDIDKSFTQNDANNIESFTNKANTKSKKIEYDYEKDVHSNTMILNQLSTVDERKEENAKKKPKKLIKIKKLNKL